jgi:hypothetical protein
MDLTAPPVELSKEAPVTMRERSIVVSCVSELKSALPPCHRLSHLANLGSCGPAFLPPGSDGAVGHPSLEAVVSLHIVYAVATIPSNANASLRSSQCNRAISVVYVVLATRLPFAFFFGVSEMVRPGWRVSTRASAACEVAIYPVGEIA